MPAGNPRCGICHGRGGWRSAFGWTRCPCTRPTKAQQVAIRRMHLIGTDKQPRLPGFSGDK